MKIVIKWTKDNCRKVALQYNSRGEFSKNSRTCYTISARNKWLDDICSHMKFIKKRSGYWTFNKCKEVALKCDSQKEFYKNFRMAYESAKKNDWLDDIRTHFKIVGNRYERLIYAILFKDKSVYIGLTHDVEKRYWQHLNREYGTVYKHMDKTGLVPNCIKLTPLLDINSAKLEEKKFVEKYKNDGFFILNKAKTGALGSSIKKWGFEECKNEALKYKSRNEFCIQSSGAYQSSIKNKWLDELCSHMVLKYKPNGYWTYNTCKESSSTCKNKEEFYKKFGGGFVAAKKNGWLNIFFPKNN